MNLGLAARTRLLCVLTFMLSLTSVATAQGPVARAHLFKELICFLLASRALWL